METEGGMAREQLGQLDKAMKASTVESFDPGSWWQWLMIAFMGPALIWGFASQSETVDEQMQGLLWFGALAMGAVALVGVVLSVIRVMRSDVRAKSPLRGGPKPTKWLYLANLSGSLPMIVGINLTSISDVNRPFLIGALLYFWLAIVPGYLNRRHAEAIGRVGAI